MKQINVASFSATLIFLFVFVILACGSTIKNDRDVFLLLKAIDQRDLNKTLSYLSKDDDIKAIALEGVANIQPDSFPTSILVHIDSPSEKVRKALFFAISQCFLSKPFTEDVENLLVKQLERESNTDVKIQLLHTLGISASDKTMSKIASFSYEVPEIAVAQGMAIASAFMRNVINEALVLKCVELCYFLIDKKTDFYSPFYAMTHVRDVKFIVPHIDTLVRFFNPKNPAEPRMYLASVFANMLSPDGFNVIYQIAQDSDSRVASAAIQGIRPYSRVPQIKEPILKLIEHLLSSSNYHILKSTIELTDSFRGDSLANVIIRPKFEKLLTLSKSVDIRFEIAKRLLLFDVSSKLYQQAVSDINLARQISPHQVKLDTAFLKNDFTSAFYAKYKEKKHAVIETTKGKVKIELFFDETPYTVRNFIELASQKYYDNTIFHRVVSNFVVQGGDPLGTGTGGPGYAIRSEFTRRSFLRGVLGMASSGKDTEGSQFFFMSASQPHLNGRYTPFARVVTGIEIIDKLEIGDKIISIYIK